VVRFLTLLLLLTAGIFTRSAAAFSSAAPSTQTGGIAFEEVTESAGIAHTGRSHGVSIGDANGDGWPDIWDDNHQEPPSLYINQGDGAFVDMANILNPPQISDQHGAAWADFENDGDQDLIVLAGGGAEGSSGNGSPNLLFVNQGDGSFIEDSSAAGVEYAHGRGRTPLWLDHNLDGLFDLIFFNQIQPDGVAPPALFQGNGQTFLDVSQSSGFEVMKDANFGLLTNLIVGGPPTLFVHGTPFPQVVFSVGPTFQQITTTLGISPKIGRVQDAILADFDGDLDADLYTTRSVDNLSEAVQVNANELRASFQGTPPAHEGITFQVTGTVTVSLFGTQSGLVLTDTIFIGASGFHPNDQSFTLLSSDPAVAGMPAYSPGVDSGLFAGFDPSSSTWSLFCSEPTKCRTQVIIQTENTMTGLATNGFDLNPPQLPEAYWKQTDGTFADASSSAGFTLDSRCGSAVAADFDNDMDLDIYQMCSRNILNLPNLLYENQGNGTFIVLPQAGGAGGTAQGTAATVVTLDYDQDGFLDLYTNNGKGPPPFNEGPNQLFHNLGNGGGNGNHWVEIDLVGTTSNRDGVGAVVYLTAGGVTQVREQNGGMHLFAQNQQRLHFGLAGNLVIDKIEIHWPSGNVQTEYMLPADRLLTVVEGEPIESPYIPYLSTATNGIIGNLRFKDEDIIAYDPQLDNWFLYFDGSDLGLRMANVDALALLGNGEMLLSFTQPVTLPDIGAVDDSDIVRFAPTSLGMNSAGTFHTYFTGADHGLTTATEDVDAIALNGSQLLISTVGWTNVPGARALDEDILAFDWDTLTWSFYFDGSDIGLQANTEDIVALWQDAGSGTIHFSTQSSYNAGSLSGNGNDIIACSPLSLGQTTSCSLSLFWDGDLHQLSGELIDALDMR